MAALDSSSSAVYIFGVLCFVNVFGIRQMFQTQEPSSLSLWLNCGVLAASNDSNMSRKFPSIRTAEDSVLLRYDTESLGNWIPPFRRNVLSSSSKNSWVLEEFFGTRLPRDSASNQRRSESSATPLRKPQNPQAHVLKQVLLRTYKIRSLNLQHKQVALVLHEWTVPVFALETYEATNFVIYSFESNYYGFWDRREISECVVRIKTTLADSFCQILCNSCHCT
jgi:hypothetical protein